jgi:Flp pilus assembly protein protease CpaA
MDTKVWTVLLIVALCVTSVAAIVDYRTGQIPNGLTLSTLVLGPIAHVLLFALAGKPGISMFYHAGNVLVGALLCACVPFALWRTGGLGGGDLKLFTALGGLLGLQRGLEVQLLAFLIALLLLPTVLAWRGKLWSTLRNTFRLVTNLRGKAVEPTEMTEVRFGPAIFAGTLASACLTWLR